MYGTKEVSRELTPNVDIICAKIRGNPRGLLTLCLRARDYGVGDGDADSVGRTDKSGVGEGAGELSFNEEGAFIDSPKEWSAALGDGVALLAASVGPGLGSSGVASV